MKVFFGFFYVCVQADWFAQEEIVIAIIQSSVNPINIIKKKKMILFFSGPIHVTWNKCLHF